uniref:Opsin 8, group member c n=1 Tax=Sander lucioperca TaxID=283035 RepID=A0A8C9WU42_SANLU
DFDYFVYLFYLFLLSVLGNGLVLVICYRRRKKMVGSELLCVNLAVVDFLCCICFYPLSILSSFHHGWLGENITCVYYGLGCYIFGLCGMFTIAAISMIRYLKTSISPPFSVFMLRANINIVCCSTWLIAAVWSSFPLFGWGKYVPEPYGLSCTVAWRGYHTSAKDAFYVICSFACFTMVPILLIVVSQCQILYKVSRFSHLLSARHICNNRRYAEKQLSMFFCISLGFVIAWAPYTIVSFLFIFHKGSQYMAPEGFVFPALFAKSSHIYNPFIYFYFNKPFQKELRCLLLSFCSQNTTAKNKTTFGETQTGKGRYVLDNDSLLLIGCPGCQSVTNGNSSSSFGFKADWCPEVVLANSIPFKDSGYSDSLTKLIRVVRVT